MTKNGKHVILYVEDDADYREAVRLMLEAGGYEVIEAATAEEGLQSYQAEHPDLVIVDLMMEEIDAGTNLVKDLRAHCEAVPIYLLSSVADSLTLQRNCSDLGLAGVFQKPIKSETLLAVLKSRLG